MKPTLVLISILAALILVSIIGYALGQLGKGSDCECPDQVVESDQEMKAGLSDMASAFSKIEGGSNPQQVDQVLQEFQSCWPKLLEQMEGQDLGFSDSEETAMMMVAFGVLVGTTMSLPFGGGFDEAMKKCASLN